MILAVSRIRRVGASVTVLHFSISATALGNFTERFGASVWVQGFDGVSVSYLLVPFFLFRVRDLQIRLTAKI